MIFQNNRDPLNRPGIWFKGGGSSGDSYDAAYNARMATIAESQQDMAETYFDFWQSDYKPMEQAQITANMELIPSETALSKAENEAAMTLLPSNTNLTLASNEAAIEMLPWQTKFTQAQITDALTGMKERAPVRTKFFNESLNGVDVEGRVNRAGADATQAFKNSTEQSAREVARMGLNPNKLLSKTNSNSLEQAKLVSGARTKARTGAENENYQRLTNAMGY